MTHQRRQNSAGPVLLILHGTRQIAYLHHATLKLASCCYQQQVDWPKFSQTA